MDVEKSSVAGPAFRASCVAAVKALALTIGLPILVKSAIDGGPAGQIAGILFGALFVFIVVRKINRHDDSRHAKRPPDAP